MSQDQETKAHQDVRIVASEDTAIEQGLRIGAKIDEFVIDSFLGHGGTSEVYRAADTRTESVVALKFLLPSHVGNKQACARLRAEAKNIMSLRHPHIVSVVDVRENEALGPYLVMELVQGEPLSAHLPMPLAQSLAICTQVAEALAFAHTKGMIHRDVKPSNVMMVADGSIKLVDFGIAKVFLEQGSAHIPLTRTSEAVGTSLYMSPEQCFGQEVDARTDIYQLGCLLYQCITGFPPFEASTSFEAMFKHVSVEPNLSAVPESLRGLLAKAMDKNPENRFQSAAAMGAALRDAGEGKAIAHKQPKSPKRWRFAALLGGVLIGLVVAQFTIFSFLKSSTPTLMGPLTPSQIEAQYAYEAGVDLKGKGWTEKARASLSKAIKLDNGPIGFKALCYLRARLPAHFQPEEAEQLNIKAYNLEYSGRKDEAEKVWLECIERYPNFEWPYSNLASLYLDQGKLDKALPLLEKAIEINPYYTNGLRNMADAQLKAKNLEQAIKYMERAADSSPEDPSYKKRVEELQRYRFFPGMAK